MSVLFDAVLLAVMLAGLIGLIALGLGVVLAAALVMVFAIFAMVLTL